MGTDFVYLVAFVGGVVWLYFFIKFFLKAQKPSNSTTECYVGGLGTGKTFLAVKRAVKIYKKAVFRYDIYKFFNKNTKIERPQLISNIPIKLNKKTWSTPLEVGHLLQTIKIPLNSVVLIDEIGNIISQHDYNNPIARLYLTPFIRLFRHWTDGKLIVTDQSSGSVLIDVRRRLNVLYSLSRLEKRFFNKVYKISFFEVIVSEDAQSVVNANMLNQNYFAGWFPRFKHYESRTFAKTYLARNLEVSNKTYDNYYTSFYLDFSPALELLKSSQKNNLTFLKASIKEMLNNGEFVKKFDIS